MNTRLLVLSLLIPLGGCTNASPPTDPIRSPSDALVKLSIKKWHTEEFGRGTRVLACRQPFKKDRAMAAFAHHIRNELDGVVLIAPEDSGNLFPELVSKKVDNIWLLGESYDVDSCVRALRQ